MKLNITKVFLISAIALGTLATYQSNAGLVKTTRGYRLDDTKWTTVPLKEVKDFQTLKEGDKVAVYCPMRKRYLVTTIRNVDSKGRVKIKETQSGWKMDECNVVLQRKPGSQKTQTMIVCPDGTLNPTTCKKLVTVKK